MLQKIEAQLEDSSRIWDRTARQSGRADIQRDVPPVIERRRECHADLPRDLRPHVQGAIRVPPFPERQRRPQIPSRHIASMPWGVPGGAGAVLASARRLYWNHSDAKYRPPAI